MKLIDGTEAEDRTKSTPYAVDCPDCGTVHMTNPCYDLQMDCPDAKWRCPRCGQVGEWNDAVFEASLDEAEA